MDSAELMTPASRLLREGRRASGLSQRGLAAASGTSGPTVAAYESGSKDPRSSTLARLLRATGSELALRPAGGAARRARRRRRSLALAGATAALVDDDPAHARRLAEQNLLRLAGVVEDNASRALLEEWRCAVDDGPAAVRALLLDPSEHGDDLRQMTPFAGLLPEATRHAVLAGVDAAEHA